MDSESSQPVGQKSGEPPSPKYIIEAGMHEFLIKCLREKTDLKTSKFSTTMCDLAVMARSPFHAPSSSVCSFNDEECVRAMIIMIKPPL